MSKRAERAAVRRQTWHENQVNSARTSREKFWRACGWLVAEAWHRGRLDEVTESILTKVHELREEANA